MVITRRITFFILIGIFNMACNVPSSKLPILGNPIVEGTDTTYPVVADFSFVDQDSNMVTNQTFANKVYVADFIFLSCPTICPTMTKQMFNAYKSYSADERVAFISHTIDPKNDTVPRLKAFANKLGISSKKWHFVAGNQDSVINLSEQSYFSAAYPDSTSPGGFTHSGGLLLVDKDRHIRGVYNSLVPSETQRLIGDIHLLLKEQF